VKVVSIPNGRFAQNCYLAVDDGGTECAVIDPGEETGLILERLAATGARAVAIWLTHAHVDHVLGVGVVQRETGAPVYLHPDDRPLYDRAADQAAAFGMPRVARALPAPDHPFSHGDIVRAGALAFEVRHTPGHSPGSVSLVGQGAAFTGDVLFQGSIGRTDLYRGDFDTLIQSIERELLPLPDDTIVYSGHGPETTIGRERRANPFLAGARPVRPRA
jgi:glyoxylase-like metal-dependent hydrolase (beta-lactamase superfamily II)